MFLSLCSLAFALLTPINRTPQAEGVRIEQKVSYLGAPNNIRMSNGVVELIISTDYGPRIMRYAPVGSKPEANLFATMPGVTATTPLGEWWIRGGHRLWHAPESKPRTYEPDNDPVSFEIEGNTVKLKQAVEKTTLIQKEMWVTLDPKTSRVTVLHKLTNKGLFPVEMACWALSVMNQEGKGVYPQEPYRPHTEDLLPARPMVLWSYTNLKDPRWMLGSTLLTLTQDPNNKEPQKIGLLNKQGWAAYARKGWLFIKRFRYEPGKTYPDFQCNMETFTNEAMLEVETLGSLEKVAPEQSITHTEEWWLFKKEIGETEATMNAALLPLLKETEAPK
jgi:hypothetical protein